MKKAGKRWLALGMSIGLLCSAAFSAAAQEAESAMSSLSIRIASEYLTGDLFETYEDGKKETVAADAAALSVKAKGAVLMEVSTGKVLYEMNPDEKLAHASITKIMSLLLVTEAIESGKIRLEDTVTASETAASMGGSQIWLKAGETMTVHELLKAAAVASANDACVALAEHIAGSVEEFVARMNERAARLGMKNTTFVNCTGLDADGHLTTARDVALMSRELIRHDLIREYTQIWIDYLRNGETQLVNTNKLVRFYEGTTGLKTGTTSKAGYCLSATAQRDGMELVAVVMGGESGNERFNAAKRMLNYGFANFRVAAACPTGEQKAALQSIPVRHGKENSVSIRMPKIAPVVIPKGNRSELRCNLSLPEEITAPVTAGQKLGTLTVLRGEETVAIYDLCAAGEVKKLDFLTILRRLLCA